MIEKTEIASLMLAVQRAGTSLSDEILQIVSASAEPMCCKDIYEKSFNAPDTMTLSIEVHRMTAKAGLLEIVETKKREGFRPVAFYRLSALGHEQLRTPAADVPISKFQKNVIELQEPATKVKSIASPFPDKSKEMPANEAPKQNKGSHPGELNTIIYNKIVVHPGITEQALIEHARAEVPAATDKQIKKTLGNMRHIAKKIRVEGKRGNYAYHLNNGVPAPAAQKAKPDHANKMRHGKVVTGAEAATLRGDPQPAATPASSPVAKQEADPEFELLLSDSNCLHINLDGEQIRLSAYQVQRLSEFLGRVLPI